MINHDFSDFAPSTDNFTEPTGAGYNILGVEPYTCGHAEYL